MEIHWSKCVRTLFKPVSVDYFCPAEQLVASQGIAAPAR